jgi:hypothetical protein
MPYLGVPFLAISDMMPGVSENQSICSLEELVRAETENQALSKTVRVQANALVNSRLAKTISFEDYAVLRQQGHENAAECKRQGTILRREIRSLHRR